MPRHVNPIDGQVGNRLRVRRVTMGMSQEKLGERVGLTFQQIQKYEKGANRIGAGRLFELAHILGVPVNYFYDDVLDQISPEGGPQESAHAHVQESAHAHVMEFLASNEGVQLSLAFMAIKDSKVRRRILDLVKALADENEQSQH